MIGDVVAFPVVLFSGVGKCVAEGDVVAYIAVVALPDVVCAVIVTLLGVVIGGAVVLPGVLMGGVV